MGYKLLNDSHTQIMAFLASTGKNINGPMGMPTEAIVALWDPSVDWSGGAWHSNVRLYLNPALLSILSGKMSLLCLVHCKSLAITYGVGTMTLLLTQD